MMLEKQSQLMFVIVPSRPWCTLLGSHRTIETLSLFPFPLGNTDSTCHPTPTFLRKKEAKSDVGKVSGCYGPQPRIGDPEMDSDALKCSPVLTVNFGGLCALSKCVYLMLFDNTEIGKILSMFVRSTEFREGDRLLCQHQINLIKLVPK